MAPKPCYLFLFILLLGLLSRPSAADQVLYPRSTLFPDQFLSVDSYKLTMQKNCDLVLSDHGRPIWASNTAGKGKSCRVTMQGDGDLVIFNGSGGTVWSSGTATDPGNYALALQRDRNLVIYGTSQWATSTTGVSITKVGPSGEKAGQPSASSPAAKEVNAGLGGRKVAPGGKGALASSHP